MLYVDPLIDNYRARDYCRFVTLIILFPLFFSLGILIFGIFAAIYLVGAFLSILGIFYGVVYFYKTPL